MKVSDLRCTSYTTYTNFDREDFKCAKNDLICADCFDPVTRTFAHEEKVHLNVIDVGQWYTLLLVSGVIAANIVAELSDAIFCEITAHAGFVSSCSRHKAISFGRLAAAFWAAGIIVALVLPGSCTHRLIRVLWAFVLGFVGLDYLFFLIESTHLGTLTILGLSTVAFFLGAPGAGRAGASLCCRCWPVLE